MYINKHVTDIDLRDAMNMAKARVRHYQQTGWTMFAFNELLGAANEGIAEALCRFEPTKGTVKDTKFTSYAYFWIEKYLKEYITKNKTLLAGTNAELWTGQVPYTTSIDAYDDKDSDEAGSDHKDWLGTNVSASALIESSEHTEAIQQLLSKVMLELDASERLVLQLSLGIGTVNKEQLDVKSIAKSCNMTKPAVQALLASAMSKLQALRDKYKIDFDDLL